MRLLNVDTYELQEFGDDGMKELDYAILSHRWQGSELVYKVYQAATDRAHLIDQSQKISGFCKVARKYQFTYVWIDSLCINQESSAELSEAINSMYNWYAGARKCFIYLQDVAIPEYLREYLRSADSTVNRINSIRHFDLSEWWERGWTLQELIAPSQISFYDVSWHKIEDLENITDDVTQITKVPATLLRKEAKPSDFSIAQRMSWAASRETTKGEDRAYSLLGLFDVNIPANYGEGSLRAFLRLQEELIKQSTDQSIFAWEYPRDVYKSERDHLLASSPEYFRHSEHLLFGHTIDASGLAWTSSIGLQTTIRMIDQENQQALLILNCRLRDDPTKVVAIPVVHDADLQFCLPQLPREYAPRLTRVDTLRAVRDATKRTITICRSWKQYEAISQPYRPKLSYAGSC